MPQGINKLIVIGMIGQDPEMKYTLSGKAIANFTLAVEEEWGNEENQKHTDWFDVEARGRGAEFIGQYLHKGDCIYLEGILRTNKWEKDGITYYTAKIVVQDCRFLVPNAENSEGSTDESVTDVASDKVAIP